MTQKRTHAKETTPMTTPEEQPAVTKAKAPLSARQVTQAVREGRREANLLNVATIAGLRRRIERIEDRIHLAALTGDPYLGHADRLTQKLADDLADDPDDQGDEE